MRTLTLEELLNPDVNLIGGKAAGLARLHHAGFRVPAACVITTELTAALDTPGESRLAAAVAGAVAAVAPEGQAIAVRSSAVDEDSEQRSFAGQHLTVLGIVGPEAAMGAVRKCVASLQSEEAEAYRAAHGGSASGGMAVVLQRMVPADAAGVAFTVDPLTGDSGRVIVEAVAGLGESLVSGRAEPDRWVFHRDALEQASHEGPSPVVLSEGSAREVARLALDVEAALGGPQDVEFAVEGDTVWLLQARPVTATAATAGTPGEFDTLTSDADLWTSANIGEVLPGLLTPLSITVFAENGNQAYCRAYQRLKMLAGDECPRFVGFFYNRAFLHVGHTRLIAERAFGGSADAVEEHFLGAEKVEKRSREHSWKNIKHRFLSLVPLIRMTRTISDRADEAERATLRCERDLVALHLGEMSGAGLDALRHEISELVAETFAVHLQASGCAAAGYDVVARMVRPILKERTDGRVPALFAGLREVESARIALDLWEVAMAARSNGIEDRVRSLGFDPNDPGLPAAWREAYSAFMERHGHRGVFEMEPAQPSWRRDPSQVLGLIAGYLDIDPEHSPPAVLDRREAERLRLTKALERRMNPVTRKLFRWVLSDAQKWVALRERTKSIVVRGTRLVDIVIPEASRRLVEAGAIAEPDDIFFLTGEELTRALHGGPTDDLKASVLRRRRDFERNRHVRLPERFRGYPTPLPPAAAGEAAGELRGTPVSPGQVTGRARVILDPRSGSRLQPGEILVAPVTDAGWTPLFAIASGLVVDIGSALSHGSTVAREYGLPAVVNVREGTSSIRDGDLIAVDGAAGTVTILERAAPEPSGDDRG